MNTSVRKDSLFKSESNYCSFIDIKCLVRTIYCYKRIQHFPIYNFTSIACNPMNKDFCIFIHQTIFFKNFRKRFLLIDEFKFLVQKKFSNCMSIISCRLPCVITGIENTICPSIVKLAESASGSSCGGIPGIHQAGAAVSA